MTYDQQAKIQQEVVLGRPAPDNEPDEQRQFRAGISADVAAMKKRGVMPDYPTDWDVEK